MRNKIYAAVLFVLFILGVSIFVLPQKEVSIFERRGLHTNQDFKIMNVSETAESILQDQFPIRDKLIMAENIINKICYMPINKTMLKIKDEVVSIEENIYINEYISITKENVDLALNRAYNIQEISKKYPNVKTYVYFPTKIEETYLLDTNGINSFLPELRTNFIINLGELVTSDSLDINTLDDYKNYYYKTDHHWNGYGVYEAYKDIINMIGEDFNIEKPKKPEFEIINHSFYGTKASKIGYICQPDRIISMKVDTKEYSCYIDGLLVDDNKFLDDYKKNGNTTPYTDYQIAFGSCDYETIYDFKTENKPNVLVFGDSYINAMKKSLASHFNKTIYIDMRSNVGEFSLDEYINKYDIDAILFLQYYEDLYFNGYFVPLN